MRVTVLYKSGHVRHRLVATLLALATGGCAGPSLSADAESSPVPSSDTGSPHQAAPMKLRITIEDAVLTAKLEDNAATRDFVSLLPLTLTLRDYAGTEKVSDLPRRLSQWGGAKQEIRTGDVVWTPPGVKHWHGATAVEGMTHIAVLEHVDGKVVDWLEQVSDEQYATLVAKKEEG